MLLCSECASAPQSVNATFPASTCGNTTLVEWFAPANGIVDEYFAECVSSFDAQNATVPAIETSVEVGPLRTDNVEYNCTVIALNMAGPSESGAAEPFTTR